MIDEGTLPATTAQPDAARCAGALAEELGRGNIRGNIRTADRTSPHAAEAARVAIGFSRRDSPVPLEPDTLVSRAASWLIAGCDIHSGHTAIAR